MAPETGEYYHIYNRGAFKHNVFLSDSDRIRFLFNLIYFQAPDVTFDNLRVYTKTYKQSSGFEIEEEIVRRVVHNREVELAAFTLMHNHFHLLVRELSGKGIPKYLQRISVSYTKYFNILHESSGHIFQGKYRAVHISKNSQLLHTSAYIHRNCNSLSRKWRGRERDYNWSSLQDYVFKNRWDSLLSNNIVMGQFNDGADYWKWLQTSPAKDFSTSEVEEFSVE